ncbi:DPP IV N-terminal domain-containing protein [Chitinophaga sp. Cy-1792]|uniref:S9 family peptidase n=1 Tax=Chitinophaga sp. Cy-1792 TaxID=2608339 RepID=UPI0014243ADD|nr:DPP IV N-terminal domain-containing protein [Chitinophaga sp. Cy-1792]NIG56211.1 S9 family peptidase [Chitinophaga sp. Cy-1792]
MKKLVLFLTLLLAASQCLWAQPGQSPVWSRNGLGYYDFQEKDILFVPFDRSQSVSVKVPGSLLTPAGQSAPMELKDFSFSADESKVLLYTNSKKVWRYETRGDYWVADISTGKLRQLGKGRPASSLMFAKFSPDGKKVAYVSEHNLYMEDIATGVIKPLTTNGSRRMINGTFDWVYEEEFDCRDGFRWSDDSKHIAYWQIDATKIRDFLMIDNTDSIYSFTVPVEYPKAGQSPSPCKVGVVDITTAKTTWLQVPGDAREHYIPRMEWIPGKQELILQQLNRRQQESKIMVCNAANGNARTIYSETDNAWIDVKSAWDDGGIMGWDFLADGKSFLWLSEKDGWRHIYKISLADGAATLLTPGNSDVIKLVKLDDKSGKIYYNASPENPLQQYLYSTSLTGGSGARVTPADQQGFNSYEISPYSLRGFHTLASSKQTRPVGQLVNLANPQETDADMKAQMAGVAKTNNTLEYIQVTTGEGIVLDGWMVKPAKFDPAKKYPVVFYVYGGPATATTLDNGYAGHNRLYQGNMGDDGYIYVSFDNRGTPLPKGRQWRKSIYKNIGVIDTKDQAEAAKALMKQYAFIDPERTAVWGWSGGGTMTLNLLCQYPGVFKTGIAIAPVTNLLTYDNIYQERYTGLPQEDMEPYKKGSPITYAKDMQGNLLMIHGTGDDNVHYQNAEMMLNELIRYNKQIQFMSYPNRTHSISEGVGTTSHLSTLYTQYLKAHCEPGAK